MRFLVGSLVESDQFTVCGEAVDGREAIEKAPKLNPDLILLDFAMPRMNGGETAVVLKRLMPHVPIILFTMHEDSVNKTLAAAMRVDRVIAKADGMTKLLECMCDVLGLPPRHIDTVGPLQLPVDPAPETKHSSHPTATPEEKPAVEFLSPLTACSDEQAVSSLGAKS
jgi:DNA-binding NarL/FixJ family response regulator